MMRANAFPRVSVKRLLGASRLLSVTLCLVAAPLTGPAASAQSIDPPSEPPMRKPDVLNSEKAAQSIPFRLKTDTVDLGRIRPGGAKTANFEIFNAARVPVTITRVTSTCSCTAAVVDGQMTVEPGQTGQVSVTISNRSNPGPMNERVTVWYRDPNTQRERNFNVAVKAEIAHAVSASPFFVDLLTKPERTGVIRLESGDGRPFCVLTVAGKPAELVTEELAADQDPAGARPMQIVRYNFEGVTDDEVGLFMIIETDHPEAEMIDLRVVSNLLLREGMRDQNVPWQTDPQRVLLGRMTPGDSATHRLQLYHVKDGDQPTFEVPSGVVSVEVVSETPNEKGREYELRFTVNDGAEGLVTDTMVITVGESSRRVPMYLRASGL